MCHAITLNRSYLAVMSRRYSRRTIFEAKSVTWRLGRCSLHANDTAIEGIWHFGHAMTYTRCISLSEVLALILHHTTRLTFRPKPHLASDPPCRYWPPASLERSITNLALCLKPLAGTLATPCSPPSLKDLASPTWPIGSHSGFASTWQQPCRGLAMALIIYGLTVGPNIDYYIVDHT
jgi:hypothetical protein